MNTPEKIGLVIKQLRTARHLSQEQLSCQCGIDQHYISNLECGKRSVSVEIIERIASFFGISLSQFFTSVDSIHDPKFTSSSVSLETIEQDFVRYLKERLFADRTINKYSINTPNCPSVREIIKEETGMTDNMYHITDPVILERVIDRVIQSDFDITGHKMYSNGLKRYRDFLES